MLKPESTVWSVIGPPVGQTHVVQRLLRQGIGEGGIRSPALFLGKGLVEGLWSLEMCRVNASELQDPEGDDEIVYIAVAMNKKALMRNDRGRRGGEGRNEIPAVPSQGRPFENRKWPNETPALGSLSATKARLFALRR